MLFGLLIISSLSFAQRPPKYNQQVKRIGFFVQKHIKNQPLNSKKPLIHLKEKHIKMIDTLLLKHMLWQVTLTTLSTTYFDLVR